MSGVTSTKGRVKIKVRKKGLNLNQISESIASDLIAAIYSSIGDRRVNGLTEGDELADVVDQYLGKDGMAENLTRMSSTQLTINVAVDISKSMFDRFGARPIVPAMTIARVLLKAFDSIAHQLPPDVFKYNIWLWAIGYGGKDVSCLTDQRYGTYQIMGAGYDSNIELIDTVLADIAKRQPYYAGSGTKLGNYVDEVSKWETENTSQVAHRLDLVVTDGMIHDVDRTSVLQDARTGKLNSYIFNVASDVNAVPIGFTQYYINAFNLQQILTDAVLAFVQSIY